MELPPAEQLKASAARFLLDGNEKDAADVMLSCSLSVRISKVLQHTEAGDKLYGIHFKLTGPRTAYHILSTGLHPIRESIYNAFVAVLPEDAYIADLTGHYELVETASDAHAGLGETGDHSIAETEATVSADEAWASVRKKDIRERRKDVLLYRRAGYTVKEMADKLGAGTRTIDDDIRWLKDKGMIADTE